MTVNRPTEPQKWSSIIAKAASVVLQRRQQQQQQQQQQKRGDRPMKTSAELHARAARMHNAARAAAYEASRAPTVGAVALARESSKIARRCTVDALDSEGRDGGNELGGAEDARNATYLQEWSKAFHAHQYARDQHVLSQRAAEAAANAQAIEEAIRKIGIVCWMFADLSDGETATEGIEAFHDLCRMLDIRTDSAALNRDQNQADWLLNMINAAAEAEEKCTEAELEDAAEERDTERAAANDPLVKLMDEPRSEIPIESTVLGGYVTEIQITPCTLEDAMLAASPYDGPDTVLILTLHGQPMAYRCMNLSMCTVDDVPVLMLVADPTEQLIPMDIVRPLDGSGNDTQA